MMLEKKDIKLPQSLSRYGGNDFEGVFLDELQQQEHELPLERFCSQDGWPDGDSLELKIESITERNGKAVFWFSATSTRWCLPDAQRSKRVHPVTVHLRLSLTSKNGKLLCHTTRMMANKSFERHAAKTPRWRAFSF